MACAAQDAIDALAPAGSASNSDTAATSAAAAPAGVTEVVAPSSGGLEVDVLLPMDDLFAFNAENLLEFDAGA